MTRLNCSEAKALLDDYLKKEITPDLAAEIRRHLEHCAPCFSEAQFEANFLAAVETHGRRDTCPSKVRARILAALEALRAEVRDR
jgi:anti-sigma factor (TIGR02949 family)